MVGIDNNMPIQRYIYTFRRDYHNMELCKLESRQLFGREVEDTFLFSDVKIDPSISPFIKTRFEIISSSKNYSSLLKNIESEKIKIEGFKAEYIILDGDTTRYTERLEKLKDLGYRIDGLPDYYNPTVIYALCQYEETWHFGLLIKHNTGWYKHKTKPYSFSNSINMDIAKSLVCIASKGNKTHKLLDACCGVGTIMLEACISGFRIEGCDINQKACSNTEKNLAHYEYDALVFCTDIKDHNMSYDAAIIDLPYNLFTYSNDAIALNLIKSTANLAPRVVIVSTSDIRSLIEQSGLELTDLCTVAKKGKSLFARKVWVCEKEIDLS